MTDMLQPYSAPTSLRSSDLLLLAVPRSWLKPYHHHRSSKQSLVVKLYWFRNVLHHYNSEFSYYRCEIVKFKKRNGLSTWRNSFMTSALFRWTPTPYWYWLINYTYLGFLHVVHDVSKILHVDDRAVSFLLFTSRLWITAGLKQLLHHQTHHHVQHTHSKSWGVSFLQYHCNLPPIHFLN